MSIDKQELQRLCDAASPGPWRPNEYGVGEFWVSSTQYDEAGEDVSVAVCILDSDIRYRVAGMDQQQADMKFIAAARTALPELLAELAAVTAERDALKAQVPEGMLRIELALSDRSISRLIPVVRIETSRINEVERYANQCWRELSAAKEEGK